MVYVCWKSFALRVCLGPVGICVRVLAAREKGWLLALVRVCVLRASLLYRSFLPRSVGALSFSPCLVSPRSIYTSFFIRERYFSQAFGGGIQKRGILFARHTRDPAALSIFRFSRLLLLPVANFFTAYLLQANLSHSFDFSCLEAKPSSFFGFFFAKLPDSLFISYCWKNFCTRVIHTSSSGKMKQKCATEYLGNHYSQFILVKAVLAVHTISQLTNWNENFAKAQFFFLSLFN